MTVRRCLLFMLFVSGYTVFAQPASCPAIVLRALAAADTLCQQTGRNQACYANVALSAFPNPDAIDFQFEQAGDIASVADIDSMILSPMDETLGAWGVALMRLQANLPDSLPGQNVTFVLFGDVSIMPNSSADAASPMQAFYLQSGIGDAPCAEAPASGVLVQTPEGARDVTFNVNGVDVSMGSTILFRSMPDQEMTISALEGAAVVQMDGALYPVVAGTWARMAFDEQGHLEHPSLPTAYKGEVLTALPINLLERDITPRSPLTPEELATLYDYLEQGRPPCDDAAGLFPACENLPEAHDETDPTFVWAQGDAWSDPLPLRINIDGDLWDINGNIMNSPDGESCLLQPDADQPDADQCSDLFDPQTMDPND